MCDRPAILAPAKDRLTQAIETIPLVPLVAGLAALHIAISLWQNAIVQINDDGILYITAARLIAEGRFADALGVYKWPSYSFVIGGLTWLTRIDAVLVARGVNIAASTCTMLMMMRAAWQVLPSKSVLVALALLLFGNIWWNDVRGAIVRDHLFFLFTVCGFYFQLRDLQAPSLRCKLAFALSTAIGILFRPDAAVFLVLVPLFRIILETRSALLRYGTIILACCAIAVSPYALARWLGVGGLQPLWAVVETRVEVIRDHVLGPFDARRAWLGYISLVVGLYVRGLIVAIGPAILGLVGYGSWRSREVRRSPLMYLALVYCGAGVVLLAAQAFFSLLMEPRYGLVLSLLLSLPAAPALLLAYQRAVAGREPLARLVTVGAAVILLYGLVAGLKKYDTNNFARDAAAWLAEPAPKQAKVLSNSSQILFYSGFPINDREFLLDALRAPRLDNLRDWKNYDYVVLHMRESRTPLFADLERVIGPPVARFENERGDKIAIFKPR